VRRVRDQRDAQVNSDTFFSCICVPGPNWNKTKWNIVIHLSVVLVIWLGKEESCGIPLSFWLAISFLLTSLEIILKEMRERMSDSPYWHSAHRGLKKAIQNGTIVLREIMETAWVIYGLCIYNNESAAQCEEKNQTYVWGMWALLAVGVVKMVCFGLLVLIGLFVFIRGAFRRKN
jgi:hypothetical protein